MARKAIITGLGAAVGAGLASGIDINNSIAPESGENVFQVKDSASSISNTLSRQGVRKLGDVEQLTFPLDLFEPNGDRDYNQSRVEIDIIGNSHKPKLTSSIALYMPPDVSISYQANWENQSLGGIAGAGREFEDLVRRTLANSAYNGTNTLNAMSKWIATTGQNLSDSASARLYSRLALNPHKALLYEGHKFRDLSLSFDLFARSPAESIRIKQITDALKKASHPSSVGVLLNSGFSFPDEFMVRFLTTQPTEYSIGPFQQTSTKDDAGYMFVFGPCILGNIDIKYGPNQAAFFVGTGAPVHVQLTLQFQEIFQLTRDHVERGW